MNTTCRLTLTLFVLTSHQLCQAATVVGSRVNPANGHTYHLIRDDDGISGVSWTDAEAEAIDLGGHLVTINDAAENAWILSAFPGGGANDFYVWIGLNDVASEGTFVWSSGEPVTYTNWFTGEPNDFNGIEDYVHIYNFPSTNYRWNDLHTASEWNSNFHMTAIAEVVPEPSAILLATSAAFLLCWDARRRRRIKRRLPGPFTY